MNLDPEELEIEANYQPASELSPRDKSDWANLAKANLRKDHRINIRLAERDLLAIQKKALQEGLPYQTLIASLLHKYAEGRLIEA